MSKLRKKSWWRQTIIFSLIVLLLSNCFPYSSSQAVNLETLTVKLSNVTNTGTVEIIDENDPNIKHSAPIQNDSAVFENCIDDSTSYTIKVTGVFPYADVIKKEVTFSSDVYDVTLQEMKGIVAYIRDENQAYINDFTLTLENVANAEDVVTKSNNGMYYVLPDVTYKVNSDLDAVKYDLENWTYTYDAAKPNIEKNLQLHTYTVTTSTDSNGTITLDGDDNDILYGGSKDLTVTANPGYMLDKLTVDGVETAVVQVPSNDGVKQYTATISDIKKDITVHATFIPIVYEISFEIGENGQVKDGSDQLVTSTGKIVVQEGKDTSFKVIPNANYEVDQILIDNVAVDLSDSSIIVKEGDTYTYTFKNVNDDHKVVASFKAITHEVTITKNEGGSVKIESFDQEGNPNGTETIDASTNTITNPFSKLINQGDTYKLTIREKDNYKLKSIKINGTLVNLESALHLSDTGEFYYTVDAKEAVMVGQQIEVKFEEVEGPNVFDIDDYVNVEIDKNKINHFNSSGNKTTYILNYDAKVKFTPKQHRYIKITYTDGTISGWLDKEVELATNKTISQFSVYSFLESVNINNNKYQFIKESNIPNLGDVTIIPESSWDKNKITINGVVKDDASGIDYVRYSTDATKYESDTYKGSTISNASLDSSKNYSFDYESSEEGTKKIYIWAYDGCGNKSARKEVTVGIDKTKPTIESISNDSETLPLNSEVTVNITAADESSETANSGLEKVYFSADATVFETEEFKNGIYTDSRLMLASPGSNTGSYTFVVENDKDRNETYYVCALDRAGNQSEVKSTQVRIDVTNPVVTDARIITNGASENGWYLGDIQIKVEGNDNQSLVVTSGIKCLKYQRGDNGVIETVVANDSGEYIVNVPSEYEEEKGYTGEYLVWYVDNSGNESEIQRVQVNIDCQSPEVSHFSYEEINNDTLARVLNVVTFGTCYKEKLKVTVHAVDAAPSSGLNQVTLYAFDGEDFQTAFDEGKVTKIGTSKVNEEDGTASFEVEPYFYGRFAAFVTDKVGHQSDYKISGDAKDNILLENKAPEATISPKSADIISRDGVYWTKEDAEFTVTVKDEEIDGMKQSGIDTVKVYFNKNTKNELTYYAEDGVYLHEFSVKTSENDFINGKLELRIYAVDKAGNELIDFVKTIRYEKTMPSVTSLKFNYDNGKSTIFDTANINGSKYYTYLCSDKDSNQASNVVVHLTTNMDHNTSGLGKLEYILVDHTKNESAPDNTKIGTIIEKGNTSFVLPANFKGGIYIKTYNGFDEAPLGYQYVGDVILETKDTHAKNASATLTLPTTTTKIDNVNLYNKNVPVTITIADAYNGIRDIEWGVTTKGNNYVGGDSITIGKDGKLPSDQKGWKIIDSENNLVTKMQKTVTVTEDMNNISVWVRFTDCAGNRKEQYITFHIDKEAPKISVSYDNNEAYNKKYYKKNRTATVIVNERNFDSKLMNATITNSLKHNVKISDWKKTNVNEYTAQIAYTYEGTYSTIITGKDLAGNVLKSYEAENFTIDKTRPTLDVNLVSPVTGSWYNKNVAIKVTVKDDLATLYKLQVSMNEESLVKDSSKKEIIVDGLKEASFVVNTNQVKHNEDGSIGIEFVVYDYAKNATKITKKIFVDNKAPSIEGYDFEPSGNIEADEKAVEIIEYGYYFKKDTKVTITAKDPKVSAGISTITYYMVDYSKDAKGVKSREITKAVDDKDQIIVQVPANFKGQIYAKATDRVKNSTKEYSHPKGTVVESPSKHKETSNLQIEKPVTGAKDNNGLELYQKDVKVDVSIADLYSGIAKVEWSIVSPYDKEKNQAGVLMVSSEGKLDKGGEGWSVTGKDSNLVTKLQKTFLVKNNSNNIKISLKLTDRAGNVSEKVSEFSIDKTAPEIKVTFNNNSFDSAFAGDTKYFKEGRTATIVVTERNFSKSDMEAVVTNTLGKIPTVSNYKENKNTGNPDETTYTATLAFDTDGDYTFAISGSDLAGNKSNVVPKETFTIDKTVPVIGVSYDNASVKNTNFYNKKRVATITIKERNFETSRVLLTAKVNEAENNVGAPKLSSWSNTGDTHTATLVFEKDGLYTFNMNYTDKAGNVAEVLPTQSFYIDQTAPILDVTGITNNTANSGKNDKKQEINVGFVVKAADENFDKIEPHLNLITSTGTKSRDDLLGNAVNITNGKQYTVKNLSEDGIYEFSCTVTDKAGNVTKQATVQDASKGKTETEQLSFSVNRKGSVYTLDKKTEAINGTYQRENDNITIVETNVNDLVESKITLFYDGNTKVLQKGTDYSVEKLGSGNEWNRYVYTISKSNFVSDGMYSVAIYSVDEAENVNENTMDTKKVEVNFGIDTTKPNVIVTDLEEASTYSSDNKAITMVISDNMKLSEVKVYHTIYNGNAEDTPYGDVYKSWNAEQIQSMLEENKDFTFDIDGSTTAKHKVKIVATDAAGCENTMELKDFYVTTNWWVNYKTNTALVYSTIIGGIVLVLATVILIVIKKRKE